MSDNFSYCFSHRENFNQVESLNTVILEISLQFDVSDFVFQSKEVGTGTSKIMFSVFWKAFQCYEVMKIFTKPISHRFDATLDSSTPMKFSRRTVVF